MRNPQRQFKGLFVVEARIDLAQITSRQVIGLQVACSPQAFGDVVARQLQVQAAQAGAVFAVDAEGLFDLRHDLFEAPGLGAASQGFGIAMHGVAQP